MSDDATGLRRWAQAEPAAWLRQAFGDDPWPRQTEILESVRDRPVTVVPSCHASGKSWIASRAALWFLYTRPDSKVFTTAPTARQVERILWPEIRSAWHRQTMPLGGQPPDMTQLTLTPTWFAFGLTATEPGAFQGIHATGGVLGIVDEGDAIDDAIWDAIKANLSTADCRLLVIGNPVDPQSRMARMAADRSNSVLPISAFDTPNFTAAGLTIEDFRNGEWKKKTVGRKISRPYLITPQWVAEAFREEGEDSPFFQSRVLGRWPDVSEDALIRRQWIADAQARWKTVSHEGPRTVGLDVARFGADRTVAAVRRGPALFVTDSRQGLDTEEAAQMGLRRRAIEAAGLAVRVPILVDTAGVGAGVYDALKKQPPVVPVDNAERADDPERFFNRRAENYWNLREMLRTGGAALDPLDRDLAAELAAVRFKINKGRIQIEEKAEIKKRLGRSPDLADAVVLAAAGTRGAAVEFLEAMAEARATARPDFRRLAQESSRG